ncbi:MAG: GyrI-like domain-containing protein [Rhodospirillales bacterium]|jgi:predicted transcriptional regulator YdeE|nr:GyrI-like domain-containing protein [Rhodospirillales bacterium]
MQPPRIVDRPAFRLMGITARTSNAAEVNPSSAKIPGLWARFSFESLPGHIPHQPTPGIIYGLYCDVENGVDGDYTLLVGCEVRPGAEPPGTLAVRDVPAAHYAVFTSPRGPMPAIVTQAWAAIHAMTPKELGGERAFTGDFERYDERAVHTQDAEIEIWISLKR